MGGQGFIASLLIAALVLSGASPAHAARRGRDARLKPTEAQEARDVVLSFLKRFHETGDIAPLAGEFFAGDFAARLRTEQDDDRPDGLPTRFLDREVLRQASPDELRRFFVAEFNFTSVMVGFMTFRYNERKAAGIDDASGSSIAEELPPEVLEQLKPDTMQVGISGDREERCVHAKTGDATDCEGNAVTAEDCEPPIKTVTQVLDATSAWEKAAAALRKRMPPLKSIFETEAKSTNDEIDSHYHVYPPQLWATGQSFFGCPAGTRLISVAAQALLLLQFRFELIRVDGRLKILSVTAVIDGD